MKLKTTIEITVTSDVSERELENHLSEIVESIKQMKYDSWRTKIFTDWEDSTPVDLDIQEVWNSVI